MVLKFYLQHTLQETFFLMTRQKSIAIATFKGIGQIMLQENFITGILLGIGILIGDFGMGVAVILASLVATLLATFLQYPTDAVLEGLYGFNAALVGAATLLLLKSDHWITWLIVILGAILATLLFQFFRQYKLKVFTLPFILITWMFLLLIHSLFPEVLVTTASKNLNSFNWIFVLLKGLGQIIFQDQLLPCIFFAIALGYASPKGAVFGIIASGFASLIAWVLDAPIDVIGSGIFGFNAVLCVLVFANQPLKNVSWALLSVLLALANQYIFRYLHLPELTFPFVAATIITLDIKKRFSPI